MCPRRQLVSDGGVLIGGFLEPHPCILEICLRLLQSRLQGTGVDLIEDCFLRDEVALREEHLVDGPRGAGLDLHFLDRNSGARECHVLVGGLLCRPSDGDLRWGGRRCCRLATARSDQGRDEKSATLNQPKAVNHRTVTMIGM